METIETACGLLTDLGDGTLQIIFNSELLSVEDVKKYSDQCFAFTDGKRVPVLSDLRQVTKTNKEVRGIFASEYITRCCKATAIIVSSGFSKVIGNIFLMANKPPYPAKLFTDPKKAKKWLKQFCDTELSNNSL